MKQTITILILFFSTIIFGQSKSNERRKTTLDKESISYAAIGKYLKKPKYIVDSSSYNAIYRNLKIEQTYYFIDLWNNANYIGEKKVKPKYCIDLYLKDGTMKSIKINNTLCEKNIYQFTTQDKDFINKLWDNATEK